VKGRIRRGAGVAGAVAADDLGHAQEHDVLGGARPVFVNPWCST
jgi:hypothetical protein